MLKRIFMISIVCSSIFAQELPATKWITNSQDGGTLVCSAEALGYSQSTSFKAVIKITFSGQDFFLDIVLPDANNFKLINLKSLSADISPLPGKGGLKIQSKNNEKLYIFNAVGSYFEDELNENLLSFDFVLPTSNSDQPLTRMLLSEIYKDPSSWNITISHKNKSLKIPISFVGAAEFIQKNLNRRDPLTK